VSERKDFTQILTVAASANNSLVLKQDGTVWMSWSFLSEGQGDDQYKDKLTPIRMSASVVRGDINNDGNINLLDPGAGLKLLSNQETKADASGAFANNRIDINDVINSIQQVEYISQ